MSLTLAACLACPGCRWDRDDLAQEHVRAEMTPAMLAGPSRPLFAPPVLSPARPNMQRADQADQADNAARARVLPAAPVVPVRVPAPLAPETMSGKDSAVDLTILEKRFDDRKVYFDLLLRNTSEEGVRVRLYVFGYDRNGRLASTNDATLYFQPREQMLRSYNFNLNSGLTRWVFTLR
jgi:hypothetical protein